MSEGTNDSISIDDLFEAFGQTDSSRPAKSTSKSTKKTKIASNAGKSTGSTVSDAASATKTAKPSSDNNADVLDVMAALGISPQSSSRTFKQDPKELVERRTQRQEQIKEQQIRSQQWQRELEEHQRRRKQMADAAEESESELQEEKPAPAATKPFREDQTQIAQPSFLEKRAMPQMLQEQEIQSIKPAASHPKDEALPQAQDRPEPAKAQLDTMPLETSIATSDSKRAIQPNVQSAAGQNANQTPPVSTPAPRQADTTTTAKREIGPVGAHPGNIADTVHAQSETKPASAVGSEARTEAETQKIDAADAPSAAARPSIKPLVQGGQSAPMPAGAPAVSAPPIERTIATGEPRPSINEPAPRPQMPVIPEEKKHHHVNVGNIVGVILIVIALVCAGLTVLLLTGTIDSSSFAPSAQETQQSSASSQAESNETPTVNGSHAIYEYVVRGTDGATHQTTETAEFNSDGMLETSTMVIDVPDEAQAQALLEQLRADFGNTVADSGIRDGEVYLTVNIHREDLDVDSYTELLSANMAEFKLVSSGENR